MPGESHGQRSLAGYSPWGWKESDTTEQLNTHSLTHSPYPQPGLLSTVEPYELVSQKYYQCAEPSEEKTRVLVSEYQGILENLGESLHVKYLK